jgi:lipopolysaccharide/colanic/teichoic acid biosynthesis glycosyltransferase
MISRYARSATKALVERALAGVLLIMLSPVMAACAVAILWNDGWPVFFIDTRVGRRGRFFGLVKFRSMRLERGAPITGGDDSRITPLGAKLRRSKLDELPQLWNVLRGQMSLIGPRPETPALVDLNSAEWNEILEVPPGMTGAASVEYFNEGERLRGTADPVRKYREQILPGKLSLEMAWLRTCSPMGDFRLLAAPWPVCCACSGAVPLENSFPSRFPG